MKSFRDHILSYYILSIFHQLFPRLFASTWLRKPFETPVSTIKACSPYAAAGRWHAKTSWHWKWGRSFERLLVWTLRSTTERKHDISENTSQESGWCMRFSVHILLLRELEDRSHRLVAHSRLLASCDRDYSVRIVLKGTADHKYVN